MSSLLYQISVPDPPMLLLNVVLTSISYINDFLQFKKFILIETCIQYQLSLIEVNCQNKIIEIKKILPRNCYMSKAVLALLKGDSSIYSSFKIF